MYTQMIAIWLRIVLEWFQIKNIWIYQLWFPFYTISYTIFMINIILSKVRYKLDKTKEQEWLQPSSSAFVKFNVSSLRILIVSNIKWLTLCECLILSDIHLKIHVARWKPYNKTFVRYAKNMPDGMLKNVAHCLL